MNRGVVSLARQGEIRGAHYPARELPARDGRGYVDVSASSEDDGDLSDYAVEIS